MPAPRSLVVGALAALTSLASLALPTSTAADTKNPLLAPLAPPAEPSRTLACRAVTIYQNAFVLQSQSKPVRFRAASTTGLPKGAQILVYGQGRRYGLPAAAGEWATPTDLPVGSYQIGLAEAGGARWITGAPRAQLTIVGARTATLRVTEKFPCEMDVTPADTGWIIAQTDQLSSHVSVRRTGTAIDPTTGISSAIYEGQGPIPVGTVRLTHAPGVAVKIWTTPGYAGTATCRTRNRTATPPLQFAPSIAGQSGSVTFAPATPTGPVTFAFGYVVGAPAQPETADAALPRAPPPSLVCPAEP